MANQTDQNHSNNQTTSDHAKKTGDVPFFEKYMTPIALLLGLVIIAIAIVYGHNIQPGANQAATSTASGAAAVNIANVKTAGEPTIGSATAPVTMAIYFDYQCPYCKQLDQTVVNQLNTNYVQTGKLRIIFKDFDFIGPDSMTGAEFGRAMWEAYPTQYYPWLTAMFNAQDEENTGFGDQASIVALTAKIQGVDVNKVVALVNQNKAKYDSEIEADRAEGASFGIQGTPSIIAGTTLLQGGQSYATVQALVDAQLKGK